MSKDKETPLMRQYTQIKARHPDTILLFRLGDFFETFGEDAVTTAKVCGITLTKRNNGSSGEMPLAGFPHHQLDSYLPKIVRAGYRVAVCEQLEDPKQARGIVRRDVVEVVTPGVALYDKMLDARRNTYICAVHRRAQKDGSVLVGFAFADASTAEFSCCEIAEDMLQSLLETIAPAEILIAKSAVEAMNPLIQKLPQSPALSKIEDWIFEEQFGREALLKQFRTQNLKGFGVEDLGLAVTAAGALIHYIAQTQQGRMAHFSSLRLYDSTDTMMLDASTRRNLEITSSQSDRDASLVGVLDDTCTAMGGRLLRAWLMRPLRRMDRIQFRSSAVRNLVNDLDLCEAMREILSTIADLERLTAKVCTMRATPRDVIAIRNSLRALPRLKQLVQIQTAPSIQTLIASIDTLSQVVSLIDHALVDEPSINFGSGGVFKPGYNASLDEYCEAMYSGKNWVTSYQEKMRNETGISTLKVSFNNVFGYYIEISNTHKNRVPSHFDRKQTLANAERYITPELKDIETKILTAEEKIGSLEQQLFAELRNSVAQSAVALQSNAHLIATLDCLQSFATVSRRNDYCEAELSDDGVLEIVDGRHPVVEKLLPVGQNYVPNSTRLDTTAEQIHIISGPNMAGKSCYLRQVGLIVLLAQLGCYVPARKANVSLCDRIFTRVGAQDNLASGESTFLVEMQEAANILHNATEKSLILLDEVGRGTATFDGISIAWSIAEYLHEHCGAKTLFATHYHELNDLSELFERIHSYKVEVKEIGSNIIFTRRVSRGATDHSFGIHVAQMAGLPPSVTKRAREILRTLEQNNAQLMEGAESGQHAKVRKPRTSALGRSAGSADDNVQMSMFEMRDDVLRTRLSELEIDSMTPLQAMQALAEMVKEARQR